jgi:hypothetical protein
MRGHEGIVIQVRVSGIDAANLLTPAEGLDDLRGRLTEPVFGLIEVLEGIGHSRREKKMEPTVRIELTTRALRKRCSTN